MGTIIKASSILEWKDNQGSIDLAVQVAKQCIASSGIDMKDIGILINLGLYREDNMAEPAMAALIQKGIGMNTDPIKEFPASEITFCFDLGNGSCGFLNAVQIVQALMNNGKIKYALLVSSDVHPSKKKVSDFPYTHYGAAVLLEQSNQDEKGFKNIVMKTTEPDDYMGVNAYCDMLKVGINGRKHVIVEVDNDYSNKLKDFTIKSINEYSKSEKIDLTNVKLIISEPAKDFGIEIAKEIGNDEKTVAKTYEKFGDTASSALSIGYHVLVNENSLKEGDQVLFVGASPGLTSICGLYTV